jgi:integrase
MPRTPEKIAIDDRKLRSMRSATNGARRPIYDTLVPGLLVRPGANGLTFYVVKRDRIAKKFKWIRLGAYPALALKEARSRARDTLAAIAEGKPAPIPAKDALSFAALIEEYKATCLADKRSRTEIVAALDRVADELGSRPAASITHEDLVTFLEGVAGKTERNATGSKLRAGGPHAAMKLRAYLNPLFARAAYLRLAGITANPLVAITNRELVRGKAFSRVRRHVIPDTDLRAIWAAAGQCGYPFGSVIRMLVLSGQRLSEIAKAQWSEIDVGTNCFVIPPSRTKNGQAHALPITPAMQALLDEVPRFADGSFIFSADFGRRPITGFPTFKPRLDRIVAETADIAQWRIHDLQRAARTGLSRAGVDVFCAELVIGHTQSGVHGVYDLHRYNAEKRDALLRWQRLLFDEILNPPPTNVVPLARAAG